MSVSTIPCSSQDFVFHQSNDWFANTNKLKRAGFTGMKVNTEQMWARQLQQLSDMKVIPSYSADSSNVGERDA